MGQARGVTWLETEVRASFMRSKRALGPAPSALIWLGYVKPDTKNWVETTERATERERAAERERGERFALALVAFATVGSVACAVLLRTAHPHHPPWK